MNKDTIIKVLLAIIALMVFAWLWRIISGMLIGTLVLTGESSSTSAVFADASGTLALSGVASGGTSTPVPLPAPRVLTLMAQRAVLTPPALSAIITPHRPCCVIVLAGYEESNMSSEYFEWPDKLAPAVIFYGIDWRERLGEATIVSDSFQLIAGNATLSPRTRSGTETSVSIAGGTKGSTITVIASAIASDGETHAVQVTLAIT